MENKSIVVDHRQLNLKRSSAKVNDLFGLNVNLNPLLTLDEKRRFKNLHNEHLQLIEQLKIAAIEGMCEVEGYSWYSNLILKSKSMDRAESLAIKHTLESLALNTATTYMWGNTIYFDYMCKQATFDYMRSLFGSKNHTKQVNFILERVCAIHGTELARIKFRKMLQAPIVQKLNVSLSKSKTFKAKYNELVG